MSKTIENDSSHENIVGGRCVKCNGPYGAPYGRWREGGGTCSKKCEEAKKAETRFPVQKVITT